MFPQFYFLSSIALNSNAYENKISQIKKKLAQLNGRISVVVVGGSIESIKLGEELFGQQNIKRKIFIEDSMKNRIIEAESKVLKIDSEQKSRYSKTYINFQQFLQQISQNENLPLQDSLIAFTKRIRQLKHNIVHYKIHIPQESEEKILLIADKQVLNHLGTTDYHQNGQPVNGLHLLEGEIDLVSVVEDEEDTIKELRKGDGIFCS